MTTELPNTTEPARRDGSPLTDGLGHTPGPWHATTADEWRTANGEHAQFGRFDISAGSVDAAAEGYYRIASVSNVNNSAQNQANAKLIAAAPELLLTLEQINAWCCYATEEDVSARLLALQQIGQLARVAMARAGGA